jgi:HK97 family phage major capsid protein
MHDMTPAPFLENKAFHNPELTDSYGTLLRAFESFKDSNDERLAQLEQRGVSDVVTNDKLDRINRALDTQQRTIDDLVLKGKRRGLSHTSEPGSPAQLQHKAAFEAYIRKGDAQQLASLEAKALSVGVAADGGYTVPPDIEASVTSMMRAISPIRAISGVRQVSSSSYKKPFSTTAFAAGWVGETAARPQTGTPALAELSFPTMELYAMPAASQALLDDSAVNIDQWVAEEVRTTFAEQEGTAFVTGDGVNKPRGFLNYTAVPNATWSWGNLGYIATGVAGGFAATNPSDKLIDLIYSVRAGYRANGTFVLNRAVQAEVRKIKDTTGNYIWQPALTPGGAPSLMNFPVAESEDMPDIAANALSLAFGDFQRGYLIVDRVGIRILRDPYSAKPYVLFYTTKRVGGGMQDFAAIKLLKFAVS